VIPASRATAQGAAFLDLQNRARRENRATQELLILYVIERWIARLAQSQYSENFVLKGGMLLSYFGQRRPTVDVDTLAIRISSDTASVLRIVQKIAEIPDPSDGVLFDTPSAQASTIRSGAAYSGVRIKMNARLATALVRFSLDVNFGDPVTPDPLIVEIPSLRDHLDDVSVLGYPLETVLSEKLVTALELKLANSRIRDFADVYGLIKSHPVSATTLAQAIRATAHFRGVGLSTLQESLSGFAELRGSQYQSYRRQHIPIANELPEDFGTVVRTLQEFADPILLGTVTHGSWRPEISEWTVRR
jgi:hypothetical protein